VVAEVAAHSLRTVHAGGLAIPLSAPSPQDQKERPLKLAERKTLPHNKPAFWSSKIHGIPANYKPKEHVQPKARPGQTAPAVERRTTAIRAKAKEAGKLVPRSQASVRLVNSVTAELKRKARGARPSPPGLRAVRPVLFHASRCTQRSFKTTPPSTRRSRRY